MARRAGLRASDLDRDQVADRLRLAAAEGRLETEELEDRLDTALSARTYGQLQIALADLPVPARSRPAVPVWARATLALAGAVGVVAAAAMAAALFAVVAAASAAWMVLTRMLSIRARQARQLPPGHVRR